MAYNEKLAEKLREALKGAKGLEEKKMFGGMALMVNGKMCVGVHKDDIIMRCDPEMTESLLKKKGAKPFTLSGKKPMAGWLLVGEEGYANKKDLDAWIAFAMEGNKKAVAEARKKK